MPRLVNDGSGWTKRDERTLLKAAKNGMSVSQIADTLGRTLAACQQKAMRLGISFRSGGLKPKRAKKRS
jgi:hypothetical protein